MEPVSRSTVVVNSTTIINKTVINEGPATAAIERASGRKVQTVPVQDLRHKEEAPVVAKQRTPAVTSEKTVAAHESQQVEKPAVATHESAAPAPAVAEFKPEAKPEGNHPPAIKEPTQPQADKHIEKQEKSVPPSDKKEQQPATEKPAANEQNGPNTADKDHADKVKE